MSSQNFADFDSLWDYSNPRQTEIKFREILLQIPENDSAYFELLTQIARSQRLQQKCDKTHEILAQDVWLAEKEPERLERLKELGTE